MVDPQLSSDHPGVLVTISPWVESIWLFGCIMFRMVQGCNALAFLILVSTSLLCFCSLISGGRKSYPIHVKGTPANANLMVPCSQYSRSSM